MTHKKPESEPAVSAGTVDSKTARQELAARLVKYKIARLNEPRMERWRDCLYAGCKRVRGCKGGPRGTFRRYGKPLCMLIVCPPDARVPRW